MPGILSKVNSQPRGFGPIIIGDGATPQQTNTLDAASVAWHPETKVGGNDMSKASQADLATSGFV